MIVAAATADDAVVTVGNGKVPSASPTDMFSLDSRFRGNDSAGVGDGAVVVGTVAGGGGGVGNGAVATRDAGLRPLRPSFDGGDGDGNHAVVVGDGHVRPVGVGAMRPDDATVATTGNTHKSSFPRTRESRTNNSAQPTEFNAAVADSVVVTVATTVATEQPT